MDIGAATASSAARTVHPVIVMELVSRGEDDRARPGASLCGESDGIRLADNVPLGGGDFVVVPAAVGEPGNEKFPDAAWAQFAHGMSRRPLGHADAARAFGAQTAKRTPCTPSCSVGCAPSLS